MASHSLQMQLIREIKLKLIKTWPGQAVKSAERYVVIAVCNSSLGPKENA